MDDTLGFIVNMRDAKTTLSKLVVLAEQGKTVMIARDGEPIVKLTLVKPQRVPTFGLWRDKVNGQSIGMDAFAPMSDEEATEWGL